MNPTCIHCGAEIKPTILLGKLDWLHADGFFACHVGTAVKGNTAAAIDPKVLRKLVSK